MYTSLDEHFKCHFSKNDNNLFDGELIFDKMCDSAYQKNPCFGVNYPRILFLILGDSLEVCVFILVFLLFFSEELSYQVSLILPNFQSTFTMTLQ